ncbi:hypothetical protein [Streptomyces enissocaesilis]|uniref:Chorismate mutase n=1 Tax=Streptomyces enissocaesilis TaxID=332589 RepID=A0ABP6JFB8_9ACTN
MTTATPNPNPRSIADLDVPAEQVAAQVEALVARLRSQRLAVGRAAELRHQIDPCDSAFARLACTHPEKCSTQADYPGWTPGGTR